MKKKKITYSLIIPAFNEEKFLPIIFESVKNQTEPFDEIIVVDNNSKDGTAKVARKFGARVVHESKKGIANARNAGAAAAKGEMICFSDADGYLHEKWLFSLKEAVLRERGKIAFSGLVYFGHTKFWKYIYFNIYTTIAYLINFANYFVFGKIFLSGNNFAIDRKTYLALGGTPAVISEDVYFSKLFWKKYPGYCGFVWGMENRISARRFEKEGYLRTVFLWIGSALKKRSQEDYGRVWNSL